MNLRSKNLDLTRARKLLLSNLEEVNALQVLSDGLIKLTQYQKGHDGLPIENVVLSAVADDAIRKIAPAVRKKKIHITNTVTNDAIKGNAQALTELFVIFLDNAVKYSAEKTVIRVSSTKTDGHIVIRISDQGVGIRKEDIPHLFDRFYRADKSRTKSGVSGYGLGLSIAKQIVNKHHGSIEVDSKIDHGTTFTITLPVEQSEGLV